MINIREADIKDCDKILNILKSTPELQASGNEIDSEYTVEYVLDCITDKKRNCVLVAEEENKLVGILTAEISKNKKYSHFTDIVVLYSKRNQGIGDMLYKRYESILKENNIKTIAGIIREDNLEMQKFCKKQGLDLGDRMIYFQKKL